MAGDDAPLLPLLLPLLSLSQEAVLVLEDGATGIGQCSDAPRLTKTTPPPPPPSPPPETVRTQVGTVEAPFPPTLIEDWPHSAPPQPPRFAPGASIMAAAAADVEDGDSNALFSSWPDSIETITTGNGARVPFCPTDEHAAIGNTSWPGRSFATTTPTQRGGGGGDPLAPLLLPPLPP